MKTQIEKIQSLENKTIVNKYNNSGTSSTYELEPTQCYIVVISTISAGNATSLNSWLIATGRTAENDSIVERLVGDTYNCTVENLELTITHNTYSIVNVFKI